MKSHKELDEQLEILSQIKDKEFTCKPVLPA